MNKFADRLKELRSDKGITQTDLAKALTVDQRTISNWEKGIREPNFDTLLTVSKFFGESTDYLLGNEDY